MNPKKTSMTCAKKHSRKLKKPKPRGSKSVLSKPTPSMKNQLLLDDFLQYAAVSEPDQSD